MAAWQDGPDMALTGKGPGSGRFLLPTAVSLWPSLTGLGFLYLALA